MFNVNANLSIYDIANKFEKMGRGDQFSIEALGYIMEFLEETSENGVINFDVIAICCDFTEENPKNIINSLALDESEEELKEALSQKTWMMELDNGNILYLNY